MYQSIVKPALDLFFSILLLIISSPLFITIALLIALIDGFPFIFAQKRTGKEQKEFTLYKFRTISSKEKDIGQIRFLGKWLRKSGLDELPQLWNIMKGDMSFIGPRPLLPEYLPLYSEFQLKRFKVKPGLLGWAQVKGRNQISWNKRFELDVYYVENQSFLLDLKIFLHSLKELFNPKGIFSEEVQMEPFKGNQS